MLRERERDAVLHLGGAIGIVGAAAGLPVQQLAADVGVIGAVATLLLELVQAAAAAAIAQALPLRGGHVLHGLAAPEREIVGRRASAGSLQKPRFGLARLPT